MNVTFSPADLEFRSEVRRYFESEFPQDILEKQRKAIPLSRDDVVRWHKNIYEKGWAAPNWPKELGGTGWTPVEKYIFADEQARASAPTFLTFGIGMVGPVIYTYGNEEQKQRFLPDILEFNTWWCQGYSESGAGSDLASLKTRADLNGDHYVVNGSKSWNTLGHYADWIFCLVRTNTDVARRQEGISFLLIDMNQPGVTVKPVALLDGEPEVNDIFFDNVKVPVENLIGEEGKGWTYGKVLLQHERTGAAHVAHSKNRLRRLRTLTTEAIGGGTCLALDQIFMRKVAAAEIELKALEYTELRTLASISSGKAPGPESSFLKIAGTELIQRVDSLYMEASAYYALPYVREQYVLDYPAADYIGEGAETMSALTYFNNRKHTIFAGSNEIQKNIIAKHVLGL